MAKPASTPKPVAAQRGEDETGIAAARIQAAGAIAAAIIGNYKGADWIKAILGSDSVTPGTAAGEIYARVLRGMIDAEPTM
jgi:hypothetical protein